MPPLTLWCVHTYSTTICCEIDSGGGAMVETILLIIIKLLFYALVGVASINIALVIIAYMLHRQ